MHVFTWRVLYLPTPRSRTLDRPVCCFTAEIWTETCRHKELVKHHYNLSETNGQSVSATLYKQHHWYEVSQEYLPLDSGMLLQKCGNSIYTTCRSEKDLPCLPVMGRKETFMLLRWCRLHPLHSASQKTQGANYKRMNTSELGHTCAHTKRTTACERNIKRPISHYGYFCSSLTLCSVQSTYLISAHLVSANLYSSSCTCRCWEWLITRVCQSQQSSYIVYEKKSLSIEKRIYTDGKWHNNGLLTELLICTSQTHNWNWVDLKSDGRGVQESYFQMLIYLFSPLKNKWWKPKVVKKDSLKCCLSQKITSFSFFVILKTRISVLHVFHRFNFVRRL